MPSLSGLRLGIGMDATKQFVSNLDAVSIILLTVTLAAFLVPIFILFPPVTVDCSDVLRQTHSRAGVASRPDDLRRESSGHRVSEVKSRHISPVESCRGIELQSNVTSSSDSMEYHRLYTFAQLDPQVGEGDSPVWEAISSEHFPLLANIEVDLWTPDPNKSSRLLGKVDGSFLVLRFPWTDAGLVQQASAKISHGFGASPEKEFMLPVSFPDETEIRVQGYSFAEVKIEGNITTALNMDVELPAELARYLGVGHHLGIFRVDDP
ncbi:Mosc containing protein [Fusarium acuminatum]